MVVEMNMNMKKKVLKKILELNRCLGRRHISAVKVEKNDTSNNGANIPSEDEYLSDNKPLLLDYHANQEDSQEKLKNFMNPIIKLEPDIKIEEMDLY